MVPITTYTVQVHKSFHNYFCESFIYEIRGVGFPFCPELRKTSTIGFYLCIMMCYLILIHTCL